MNMILYILTIACGVGAIATGWRLLNTAMARRWPMHEATIIESYAEKDISADLSEQWYCPKITYEYSVRGHRYQSSNFNFQEELLEKSAAELVCINHPVGKKITIRVHPQRPKRAVIYPGINASLLVAFISSIGFGLICLYVLYQPFLDARMMALTTWLENL